MSKYKDFVNEDYQKIGTCGFLFGIRLQTLSTTTIRTRLRVGSFSSHLTFEEKNDHKSVSSTILNE